MQTKVLSGHEYFQLADFIRDYSKHPERCDSERSTHFAELLKKYQISTSSPAVKNYFPNETAYSAAYFFGSRTMTHAEILAARSFQDYRFLIGCISMNFVNQLSGKEGSEEPEIQLTEENLQKLLAYYAQEALYLAIGQQDIETVYRLLGDPLIDPKEGAQFAIKLAALVGNIKIFKALMNDSRVDITVDYNHVLNAAAWMHHFSLLEFLLELPESVFNPNHYLEVKYYSPHYYALEKEDNPEIVKYLLNHKAFQEKPNLLAAAASKDRLGVFRFLLKDAANNTAEKKEKAFYAACSSYSTSIVFFLLKDLTVNPTKDHNRAFQLVSRLDSQLTSSQKKKQQQSLALLLSDDRVRHSLEKEAYSNPVKYNLKELMYQTYLEYQTFSECITNIATLGLVYGPWFPEELQKFIIWNLAQLYILSKTENWVPVSQNYLKEVPKPRSQDVVQRLVPYYSNPAKAYKQLSMFHSEVRPEPYQMSVGEIELKSCMKELSIAPYLHVYISGLDTLTGNISILLSGGDWYHPQWKDIDSWTQKKIKQKLASTLIQYPFVENLFFKPKSDLQKDHCLRDLNALLKTTKAGETLYALIKKCIRNFPSNETIWLTPEEQDLIESSEELVNLRVQHPGLNCLMVDEPKVNPEEESGCSIM